MDHKVLARRALQIGKQPGHAPDMKGTPGTFLEAIPTGIVFAPKGRISPYDALLIKLRDACEGPRAAGAPKPGLVFDDAKAQTAVLVRAKKMGIRVSFSMDAGKLYVRYDGRIGDDEKTKRRAAILNLLARSPGPMKYIAITNQLRAAGDELLDPGATDEVRRSNPNRGRSLEIEPRPNRSQQFLVTAPCRVRPRYRLR
jgi:hypothetical protein